jgi:hypothetical protein
MVCAGWEVAERPHASCASTHLRPGGDQRGLHSRKKREKGVEMKNEKPHFAPIKAKKE